MMNAITTSDAITSAADPLDGPLGRFAVASLERVSKSGLLNLVGLRPDLVAILQEQIVVFLRLGLPQPGRQVRVAFRCLAEPIPHLLPSVLTTAH